MIEAGTILQNRYRVEKQIGQGGMGAVFVATDERFGSTVAIKETLLLDEKYRKAFEREARLLNSLRHPALPRVSDHFIDGNGQFLVMEFIDGEDLSEMMEHEGKTFPLKDVLNWADQLLDALEYLHGQEMQVIHRDIKPQNLKLNSRGQIILLDFGLAKGNATSPESKTAAKSVFGYSRSYASLEQIQGTGTDPRSDLYSLAATLYHLLTGIPPADALTRAMNVLSEKEDPLVAVSAINPSIPGPVAEVLHKAMALNANQRPISAQAMRAMLWESEEAIDENAKTVQDKRIASNLFTQKTAVIGDAGDVSESGQAAAKTEILSENPATRTVVAPQVTGDLDAEKTKIRSSSGASGGPKSNFAVRATAALALLLMAAGALFYAYNRHMFGAGEGPVNTNAEPQLNAVTVSGTDSNTNVNGANLTDANATAVNGRVEPFSPNVNVQPAEKKTETAKTEAKPTPNKPAEAAKAPTRNEVTVVRTDEMDEDDEMDDDEPPIQPVPRDGRNPKEIPPDVWQKMSPPQKEKMLRALEIGRQEQLRRREIQRRRQQQQQQQPQQRPQQRPPQTPQPPR